LLLALFVVLVASAATAGIVLSQGSGHGGDGAAAAARHAPKSSAPPALAPHQPGVVLPTAVSFNEITVTSKGLLLTGVTAATATRPHQTCAAATVDPQSLAIGPIRTGNCGNPALFGQTVEAVNTPIRRTNNATVSFNAVGGGGHVVVGPVAMTYGAYSDTRPVIATGARWLWAYDVETTNGPELLQVSARSGRVVDTVSMPTLYRPLLSADDHGVWVANSVGGSPAPALSYVAAGSSTPRIVVPDTNLPICWLVASGSSAWLGAGAPGSGGCVTQSVERYADGGSGPLFSVPGTVTPVPFTVVGDEADGLWTMQWEAADQQVEEIAFIDPDTGAASVVTTLPSAALPGYLTAEGLAQGESVAYKGGLYLLEPPFHLNGYLGYASIVKVALPPRG
jgi:hypothetical protein